ncbi:MAG: PAS domain S-box protein [Candidatus Sulfotelmatobacter sp.]
MDCQTKALFCMDREGRMVYANGPGCRWLGCAREEVSALSFSDLNFTRQVSWSELWNDIRTCGSVTRVIGPILKGAPPPPLTFLYLPLGDDEFSIALVLETASDNNAQTHTGETQANFRAIFEGVETGIFVIDPDSHQIVDANPVALDLIGASEQQTVGTICHQFICPAEKGRCPVTDLGQTVDNSERTLLTLKGERRSIIKTVRPVELDGHRYLLESFLDITERKRAEKALEERTLYLNTLIETSPLGTVVLDKQERVLMSNPAFERLFLYPREQLQGQALNELIVPEALVSESVHFLRECLAGRSVRVTTRRRRKDDTFVDVEVFAVPLKVGQQPEGILALYRDITEQKQIEAELRESEDRFRTAFEEAPYGMCMTALNGRFLHANAALCQMLGYSAEELQAGAWQEITHPDDLERSRQIATQFDKGVDTTLELEKRYLHKRGKVVWAHLKISAAKNSQGKTSHYIGQIEDITLRRQADEARAFLASLVESSQDAIVGTNPQGVVMSWNRGAEQLYGYRSEEMIGQSVSVLIPQEWQEQLPQILETIRNGKSVSGYETFRIRKDGTRVDVALAISPVFDAGGKVTGLASIARDISMRKQAEQALQSSEEKFRQLAENINEVFWVRPLAGNEMIYVSPAYEQIWGRSCESIYRNPMSWADAIHPDDVERARDCFAAQMCGKRIDSIYRIRTSAGEEKWIRDRAFPVYDQKGKLTRIVGLAEDISGRKLAEERTRASEESYRELFENASDLVYTFDLDLRITSVNRLVEHTIGYSREEAIHMNLRQMVDVQRWPRVEQSLACLFAGQPTNKIEMEIQAKDGRRVTLEMNPRLILRDGKPVGIQGIARDITGRDIDEMELRQAQKLESVGRLASGIAHEINTPIQFVGDNVHFLQDAFGELQVMIQKLKELCTSHDPTQQLSSELARIEAASDYSYLFKEIPTALSQTLDGVERVVTIVRAMKEFAHPESKVMAPADVNKALQNTLTVARNELKYVADVETDFGDLPLVVCAISDMNQVFLNLLVNAAHAIADVVQGTEKKGKIRVSTAMQGSLAVITISDTGSGIPDSIRDRVFDPFFTTKEVGRGTGQGLAIARSVVERHKGTLTFTSEVGQGTSFSIGLPVADSESKPTA